MLWGFNTKFSPELSRLCENGLIRHCEGGHVRRSLGVGGTTEAIFL